MKPSETNIVYESISEKTFEELFKSLFVALCSFARKYVKDFDISKEIVHDVFVKLWEKREDIDSTQSVKSYLYTSVYNRCLNYIRDNKKFDKSENSFKKADKQEKWNYSDNVESIELEEKIHQTINSLPEKCKEVFLLNRFEQLKYQEIADKLGISIKTVEAHVSKALKVLRENLIHYLKLIIIWLICLFK